MTNAVSLLIDVRHLFFPLSLFLFFFPHLIINKQIPLKGETSPSQPSLAMPNIIILWGQNQQLKHLGNVKSFTTLSEEIWSNFRSYLYSRLSHYLKYMIHIWCIIFQMLLLLLLQYNLAGKYCAVIGHSGYYYACYTNLCTLISQIKASLIYTSSQVNE